MKFSLSLFFLALSLSTQGFAFPEMVRHGYVNCTTCHISPNGGGVLTAYGRSLSQEVLSTWHEEGESDFLWGLVKTPEWLSPGGDLRMVQTYKDTSTYREGRFIVMQADVEAAATYKKFQFDATLGKSDTASQATNLQQALTSRRHYVMYHYNDQISLRGGKFHKAFGIEVPDHIISTKRGLGWDYGTETYNLEASWLGDKYDAFVTGVFGRPDLSSSNLEKGIALRSSVNFLDRYKVGLSYFYGNNNGANRHVFGPYGILGFTPKFFLLAELDFQKSYPNTTPPTFGLAHYIRLDYEFIRGVHVFLTEELTKLDLNGTTYTNSHGIGVQFLPRPHFEIIAMYQKQKITALDPNSYADYAWVMLHFYP